MTQTTNTPTTGQQLTSGMPGEILRHSGYTDDPAPGEKVYSVVRHGEDRWTLYQGELREEEPGTGTTPHVDSLGDFRLIDLLEKIRELEVEDALSQGYDPSRGRDIAPEGLDPDSLERIYHMLVESHAPGINLGIRSIFTVHGFDYGICSIQKSPAKGWILYRGPNIDPTLAESEWFEALLDESFKDWEEYGSCDDEGICNLLNEQEYDPAEVLAACKDRDPELARAIRRGLMARTVAEKA